MNPKGIIVAITALGYLGFLPVSSYAAHTEILHKVIERVAGLVPGFSASASSSSRIIPALSAIYVFWTFGASGALSAAGQGMSRKAEFDNNHPRQHLHGMTGLPLRMYSAHYNLVENFAPWALAAALTQVLAPGDRELTGLLGYSAIAKLLFFYPAYLLNIAPVRSLAHLNANAAIINVCWRLALGSA